MSLILMILGLSLWTLAHFTRRLMPGLRRDMTSALGEKSSRGVIALVILGAVVLMVIGFRGTFMANVYDPLPGIGHLNNLLMLVAVFLMGVGPAGGRLSARIRHPMLAGVILWAVAHLLVNGDGASVILFGWLGLWAIVQIMLINGHEGPWDRPMPGNSLQDMKLLLTTVFLYGVIAGIHWLFGLNVFAGTYG